MLTLMLLCLTAPPLADDNDVTVPAPPYGWRWEDQEDRHWIFKSGARVRFSDFAIQGQRDDLGYSFVFQPPHSPPPQAPAPPQDTVQKAGKAWQRCADGKTLYRTPEPGETPNGLLMPDGTVVPYTPAGVVFTGRSGGPDSTAVGGGFSTGGGCSGGSCGAGGSPARMGLFRGRR